MLKKNIGFTLGLVTVLIHLLSNLGLKDQFYFLYSFYIFPVIRFTYDFSLGRVVFPIIYPLILILLVLVLYFFVTIYFKLMKFGLWVSVKFTFQKIINFFGLFFFLFYFLWAFNYQRPPIEKQLGLPEVKLAFSVLLLELDTITKLLETERCFLTTLESAYHKQFIWKNLEDSIRQNQIKLLSDWGDKTAGNVRIRALYPKGSLLRISTAGVYIPFICEGHVDPGLHALQIPFTLAHEMAHAHGYTDEGVCNFIGLITCLKSKDAWIRYSGLLSYWRYLYIDVKELHPEIALEKFQLLNTGIKADLIDISDNQKRYPDIMPEVRNYIYDLYLKLNGVETGLKSYDEIVVQVLRWKNSKYAFRLSR